MDTSDVICVTGGAGFMGSHIVSALVEKGYSEVYVIDDLSGGYVDNIKDHIDNDEIEFINLDLSDSTNTKDVISKIKPTIVFHLAANAREGASFFQPLEIVRRNYLAYINILEPAIKTGCLDKVILFSSMAVYGDQKSPFDEIMERKPCDIYGINKAAMEQTTELLSQVHNFRYTILRPHNVFGPRQCMCDRYRNVITIMINKILRREDINIYGDGRQKRAFSYIDDSLDCYINAMISEKCDGENINIGGSVPITVNTLSEIIIREMGIGEGYRIKNLQERFGEVKDAWCTVDKSKRLLGYQENIGFEEGIRRTVKWAKDRGSQEWRCDKLSLVNEKVPECWRD